MTPLPRIVFVNRFYWPDEPATAQLLTDLAEGLASAGWPVSVITSMPDTSAGVPDRETRHGVAIHRVRGSRLGKRSLPARVLDFLSFAWGARRVAASLLGRGDCLVTMTDPPLLGSMLAPAAEKTSAHLIQWVQDIFPEVAMVVANSRVPAIFQPWRDSAWKKTAACVTLGRDMAETLRKRGVDGRRIHISANWAPHGLGPAPSDSVLAKRSAWSLDNRFVVAYSGNLGRVHELTSLLDLATALEREPDIVFAFVGAGAQRATLENGARMRGLKNMRFFPAQPRVDLSVSLSVADLHLATLRPGCESLVFPSKLHGIAAVGRPVLFVGPPQSEIARMISQGGWGMAFPATNIAGQAEAIRQLRDNSGQRQAMGTAALTAHRANGGAARATTFWSDLLKQLAANTSANNSPQSS